MRIERGELIFSGRSQMKKKNRMVHAETQMLQSNHSRTLIDSPAKNIRKVRLLTILPSPVPLLLKNKHSILLFNDKNFSLASTSSACFFQGTRFCMEGERFHAAQLLPKSSQTFLVFSIGPAILLQGRLLFSRHKGISLLFLRRKKCINLLE